MALRGDVARGPLDALAAGADQAGSWLRGVGGTLFAWCWAAVQEVAEWVGFLPPPSSTIALLGLDNAGKTTLVFWLTTRELRSPVPTLHPVLHEDITLPRGVHVVVRDLGGHQAARRLWRQYMMHTDGVIFMVDVADSGRVAEAGRELRSVLDVAWHQADVADEDDASAGGEPPTVLVMLNKSDLRRDGMLSTAQVINRLGVLPQPESVTMAIYVTSLSTGDNVEASLAWFAGALRQRAERDRWG